MNALQLANQIKHRLQALTWTVHLGVDGDDILKVFGPRSVFVFAGAPTGDIQHPAFPLALVIIDGSTADAEDIGHAQQRFQVMLAAEVKGDPMGEFAVIGGSATAGSRANRGIAEVSVEVQKMLAEFSESDGIPLTVTSVTHGTPRPLGQGSHVAMVELSVSAGCSTSPYFAAPQRVTINVGGSSISWAGAHCSARYDFVDFRVVEKAGTSPSTSVTDGTAVATVTASPASITAIAGRTYTVFARYKDRGSEVVATSAVEVGSWLTR